MKVTATINGREAYQFDKGNYKGQWAYSDPQNSALRAEMACAAIKAGSTFKQAWFHAFQTFPNELVPMEDWPRDSAQN